MGLRTEFLTPFNGLEKDNIDVLIKCIKENVSDDIRIILKSCSTGQDIFPEENFAQTFATKTSHEVIGAIADINLNRCELYFHLGASKPWYSCNGLTRLFFPKTEPSSSVDL